MFIEPRGDDRVNAGKLGVWFGFTSLGPYVAGCHRELPIGSLLLALAERRLCRARGSNEQDAHTVSIKPKPIHHNINRVDCDDMSDRGVEWAAPPWPESMARLASDGLG